MSAADEDAGAVPARDAGPILARPSETAALDTRTNLRRARSLAAFTRNAEATVRFIRAEGRWPRHGGIDVPSEELKLGRWVHTIRYRAKNALTAAKDLTAVERAILDEVLPGWEAPQISTRLYSAGNRAVRLREGPCNVEGCAEPIWAKGRCRRHYQNPQAKPRHPWTPEEDELACSALPLNLIAARLGLDYRTVKSRRHYLRNRDAAK